MSGVVMMKTSSPCGMSGVARSSTNPYNRILFQLIKYQSLSYREEDPYQREKERYELITDHLQDVADLGAGGDVHEHVDEPTL